MGNIVSRFPAFWRVDVTVIRGGGRDDRGDPLPVVELPVAGCLVGPRSTSEPVDRADLVDASAVLYRDPQPSFVFLSTDRVRTPDGVEWMVDGDPKVWPMGVEVPLRRGAA